MIFLDGRGISGNEICLKGDEQIRNSIINKSLLSTYNT